MHAQYENTYQIITIFGRGRLSKVTEEYVEVHDVTLPAWIRDSARAAYGPVITSQQLKASGADLWVSIAELRCSDLRKLSKDTGLYAEILHKGHDYEWLCLGSIEKAHITCVMPWDGKTLHPSEGTRIVWSRSSPEQYVYNRELRQWRLDPKLYALAVFRDRKAELQRREARRKRKELEAKEPEATKSKSKASAKRKAKKSQQRAVDTRKLKRKHVLDEDGDDIAMAAKVQIIRTNAEVWDLMITAQRASCTCSNEPRCVRAGSAQL